MYKTHKIDSNKLKVKRMEKIHTMQTVTLSLESIHLPYDIVIPHPVVCPEEQNSRATYRHQREYSLHYICRWELGSAHVSINSEG